MTRLVQVALAEDVTEAEEIQAILQAAGITSEFETAVEHHPRATEDAPQKVLVEESSLEAAQFAIEAMTDPDELLGRPLEVSLTRDSGLAGLVFVIRQHTGRELAKDDPDLLRVHGELDRQFEAGRQSAVEWEEIAELLGAPAAA